MEQTQRDQGVAPQLISLCIFLCLSPAARADSQTSTPARSQLSASPGTQSLTAWQRWQQSTTEVMAGRHASSIYRQPAAAMDAYWRLAAFDRERPWLSENDAARVRDLAQVGALMGLEHMVRQTFARSEVLGLLYRIASTAGGANIDLQTDRRGHAHVHYNAETAQLRASQASFDDLTRSPAQSPGLRIRSGLAFQLVDRDESEDVVAAGLDATAYLDTRRLGLDAVRLSASMPMPTLLSPTKKRKHDSSSSNTFTGLSWSATGRQGLTPALDLFATVKGGDVTDWLPERFGTGSTLRLPTQQSWTLRTELSRRLPYDETQDRGATLGEWRAMLTLRANLRWTLPQAWDRWPLGQQVGSPL